MPSESTSRAAAVVLAAGESHRFGSAKLLMPFGTSTVIGCVVSALEAAGLEPIVVVTGERAAATTSCLRATGSVVICNPEPERGMLSSIRVGVAALPHELDRFLVALGDQPRVRPHDITRLLREHVRSGRGIAVPTHRGKRGHPVVFDRRYREEILALDDHQTLRDLIHAHDDDALEVEFGSSAFVHDIDTQDQYRDEVRRARTEQ